MKLDKLPFFVKNINVLLTLILMIMIGGYFSIVEERSVNQIYKTISRLGMTSLIFFLEIKLRKIGCVFSFSYKHLLPLGLYVLYLLLGLASVGWSTDPQYSILQWAMTFESFVFVVLFMRVVNSINFYFPELHIDLVKTFAWAIFPIMIIFVAGSFIEPDTFYRGMRGGEEMRLGGWIMNPNELGMLSAIGAATAYLMFTKKRGRFWYTLMLFAAVIVLALTSSRSSAIGFLAIMGILIMLSDNKRTKVILIGSMILIVPIMVRFIIFKDDGGVEEVLSMTGRLPFWTALLNEGIVREPFFGFGFMRINYTDYFQGLNTYPAKMTHNTFMQVLMNLGFVGFFIVFWQIVTTVRTFLKEKLNTYRNFFIALFIPIMINSFTEFGVFGEANYGIIFYQFLIVLFTLEINTKFSTTEKIKNQIFMKRFRQA